MKTTLLKILSVILTISLLSFSASALTTENYSDDILTSLAIESNTEPVGTKLDIKAKSVILIEATTGTVLYENNADEKLAIASITKVMSILLFMEAIDKGYFNLETKITASDHACSMGGSQIWLEPGETMTVDELLRATIIASANDTTVALAEAVSGSEEGFVELMNKRAKELNMTNTTFKNATGLDQEGHLSSARDVALVSKELLKHELVKKYSTVWMDALRNGESELVNTNKLVRYYDGCTGLKTGTTGKAGYCLSASAERNGLSLIAVVLNGQTSNDRFNGARKLLDYGFSNYNFIEVQADQSLLKDLPCKEGMKSSVTLRPEGVLSLLLPKGSSKEIKQTANLPSFVKAPINVGDTIGKIHLEIDGKEVGFINILAKNSVERLNFFSSLALLLQSLLSI